MLSTRALGALHLATSMGIANLFVSSSSCLSSRSTLSILGGKVQHVRPSPAVALGGNARSAKLGYTRAVCVRAGSTDIAGTSMSGGDDLYIVGAGYLGKLVGQQWRAKFPSATVYAETRSTSKHQDLEEIGLTPTLRGSRLEGVRCPNVVFCAAPSGNDEYGAEVSSATAAVWDNSGAGAFLFTSSGGIYAERDGGIVNEESPTSDEPRSAKLRGAEAACLGGGGCVIRLAGLYSVERGPHSFWLSKDELDSSPDGLINLLAYEDAASAVVAALEAAKNGDNNMSGRIFLAADSTPTSRRDICEQALRHPLHAGKTVPRFAEGAAGAGASKIYDTSVTRRDLNWQPRYDAFGDFMSIKAAEHG